MVKRILTFLGYELEGLHQAAYLLAGSAFLSQVLALIRDRLLAGHFGAGSVLDLYYAAFRIPDLLLVTLGSLVSISVIIPFLFEKIEAGESAAKRFIDSLFSLYFLLVLGASVLLYFLIPYLLPLFFPGFPKESFPQLIELSRILLLSPLLLGISNLCASVIQVHKKFLIYALSPILYNLGIIFGILYLYPWIGLGGLVWGVVFGALMHLLIQVPFLIEKGLFPLPTTHFNFSEIWRVVEVSLPRTFALSLQNISILVLLGIASFMQEGSIAVFNFSFNMQSVPLSIIGVSYSVAAFPTLARYFGGGDYQNFLKHIIIAARHIIFWSIPGAVLFIVLRAQVVRSILGSGAFSWSDTRLTAATLALFVVSLVAQGLILLFVRGYYAAGNTKTPLFINSFSALVTVVSAFFFSYLFDHTLTFRFFIENLFKISDISGSTILMLALAFTFGSFVNLILFWIMFERKFGSFSKSVLPTFYHSFAASVIMGFAAYVALSYWSTVFDLNTFMGIFLQGFFSGIVGIFAWVGIMALLKNEEMFEIWKTLHSKLWRLPVADTTPREL